MINFNIKAIRLIVVFLSGIFINAISADKDSLLIIISEELDYEMKELSKLDDPPYYISFRVDDITRTEIVASFGNVMSYNDTKTRLFTPQIRIGNYSFDNTHDFDQDYMYYNDGLMDYGYTELPIENNPRALRHAMWQSVDNIYKNAVRGYQNKKERKKEEKKDTLNDFSKESAHVYYEQPYTDEETEVDKGLLIEKLKEYSLRLSHDTSIISSNVLMRYGADRKYFVSTEGASIVQNSMLSQIQVIVMIKNKKGNVIPQNISIIGKHPRDLLSNGEIDKRIDDLLDLVTKIKGAKPAEPYAGPAILSPEAAGVFFHEIFGHRVEGHRLEKAYDGQTFTKKIGDKVLPGSFSVVCDPTLKHYHDIELIGTYAYDDEGIKSKKVTLVEDGSLKGFLMSRKPISLFPVSNGHGRAQAGNSPVSRQSNLIISAEKTFTDKELRKRLVSECKKQKKDYGYYFKSVIGGFTITDRFNPNVFNIFPSEVYRIYADGRPDELVVGVELIGTPLTMFSNIQYAGDEPGFFSGFCGAESGYIPVSAVSPAIFVKKIETQKGMEIKFEPPLLPSPFYTK